VGRRLRAERPWIRRWGGELYAPSASGCFDLWLQEEGEFGSECELPPGRYELRLVARDGTETVVAREVEAGQEDLELWLP
jgi:hypothetical protein